MSGSCSSLGFCRRFLHYQFPKSYSVCGIVTAASPWMTLCSGEWLGYQSYPLCGRQQKLWFIWEISILSEMRQYHQWTFHMHQSCLWLRFDWQGIRTAFQHPSFANQVLDWGWTYFIEICRIPYNSKWKHCTLSWGRNLTNMHWWLLPSTDTPKHLGYT